jgi:hypothetical protein
MWGFWRLRYPVTVKSDVVNEDELVNAPRDGLTPEARRIELLRYVEERKTAKVDELAEHFAVSAMTTHRDLDILTREGLLERIRGGARVLPQHFSERDVRLRRGYRSSQKQALAGEAASLIHDGDIVAFDDSTTVAAMAPHVAGGRPAVSTTPRPTPSLARSSSIRSTGSRPTLSSSLRRR